MKKFLTMLLALVMVLSLAACSSQKGGDVNGGFPASAVDLLTAVWNAYPESEKFSVVGGSLDNPVDNAPGAFPVDDADNLDYMLHFPADKADLIDDAASLTHMMNANSFTCGAFHVKNSGDVSAVAKQTYHCAGHKAHGTINMADALRQNVQNTQWMCGFPDKLVVLTYGEYVVALFGADDLVDDFVNAMTATYTGVQTACDEPLQ